MTQDFIRAVIFTALFILSIPAFGQGTPLFSPRIPDGFGLDIHFTSPAPGEMKMIADSGVRWIRMDFLWPATEKAKGVYDFSEYDRLIEALEKFHLKAFWILCYGNPLYDSGLAPHTAEGRQAFSRWSLAAAKHFAGRGILWEVWNEPNTDHFWSPKAKVEDYILLVKEVGETWKKEVPQEILIGPATSTFPYKFLKKCFEAGLLNYFSAITVHPYQRGWNPPENATKDIIKLQKLIQQYAPDKQIPVLSGEWGYSTHSSDKKLLPQAQYLVRQWLNNLTLGIPISLWYDWHDDGPDSKENEHHFGLVTFPLKKDEAQPYDPKPSYQAAKVLQETLGGYSFFRRIPTQDSKIYLLEFRNGKDSRYAAWTSSSKKTNCRIDFTKEALQMIGFLGEALPQDSLKNGEVSLDRSPVYLIPRP